jgi:hypothetical protein
MASLTVAAIDRRRHRRRAAEEVGWQADAVLRPGLLVRVVDIGLDGVLLESPARLRPGRRAELQLTTLEGDPHPIIGGRITRCSVVRVSPIGFRGAVVFDEPLPSRRDSE